MLAAVAAAIPGYLHAQPEPAAPAVPTTTPTVTIQTVQEDLAHLRALLFDESAKQETRDEAARRLVGRPTPEATEALADALASAGNPGAQLAAARALPYRDAPDERFIVPLFALFGKTKPLNDAAADALGLYQENPDVLNRLLDIARGGPNESTRIAALRSLGVIVHKRSAAALVRIAEDPDEPAAVRQAAADALAALTERQQPGDNAPSWQQWWIQSAALPDDQWRLSLLNGRAARLERLERRQTQLADESAGIIAEQYRTATDEARQRIALRMLQSTSSDLRAIGARWIYDDVFNNRPVPPAVRDQLRLMIGDSDPGVRAEVGRTLWATVDTQAVTPLLVQLRQETHPAVRAQFAQTLAKIGDARAVDDLRRLLDDPAPRVVEAAAVALEDFGPALRDDNPAVAKQIALQLRRMLETGAAPTAQPRLRSAVVEAMVAMREPDVRQTLLQLLGSQEDVAVRRAVLRGMGELRDSAYADVILDRLLNDTEDGIRLEAARALTYTALPEQATTLYPRLGNAEPNPDVRAAVWRVLQTLFPQMNDAQLRNAVGRFERDPQRQVLPQQALRDLLIAAGRDSDLAYARQKLGEIYMNLQQPEKAVAEFQAALDHWSTQGRAMESETLMRQLLEARLRARQYREAVRFGAALLADDTGKQELVGPMIRDEADRLVAAERYRDALTLIEQAEQMTPPLAARYLTALDVTKTQATRNLPEE